MKHYKPSKFQMSVLFAYGPNTYESYVKKPTKCACGKRLINGDWVRRTKEKIIACVTCRKR